MGYHGITMGLWIGQCTVWTGSREENLVWDLCRYSNISDKVTLQSGDRIVDITSCPKFDALLCIMIVSEPLGLYNI